jgi:hypothetical protein
MQNYKSDKRKMGPRDSEYLKVQNKKQRKLMVKKLLWFLREPTKVGKKPVTTHTQVVDRSLDPKPSFLLLAGLPVTHPGIYLHQNDMWDLFTCGLQNLFTTLSQQSLTRVNGRKKNPP